MIRGSTAAYRGVSVTEWSELQ